MLVAGSRTLLKIWRGVFGEGAKVVEMGQPAPNLAAEARAKVWGRRRAMHVGQGTLNTWAWALR
jgi:hypothetical protein